MPFRPIQWARRSVEGRQVEADGSRLLNFYAVQLADPSESKVPVMIYSSPGQRRFMRTNGTKARAEQVAGVHALLELDSVAYGKWLFGLTHQSVFFAVRVDPANGGAYQIDRDYDPFSGAIYGIPDANTWRYNSERQEEVPADQPRKLVSDGRRIVWVGAREVFAFDLHRLSTGEGNPFSTIQAPVPADLSTLEDLPEQDWVDCLWIDGYFILAARSGQFFHSNLDSLQFDQLDFAEAGSHPDSIVGIETLHRRIYILGDESIEAWYNAGNADFAFSRDNGMTINIGCAARATIAADQYSICFLGNDGIAYALMGGAPRRISTESVEYDVAESDATRARGVTYTEEGHRFYLLTLVYDDGSRKAWGFDFATGVWHERSQTDILCVSRWQKRRNLIGREGAQHIFDMRLNWGIIENDATGAEGRIEREAVSPLVFANLQRFKMRSFLIDVPLRDGGEADDSIVIEWSDDGKREGSWKGRYSNAVDGDGDRFENKNLLDDGPRLRRYRLGQTYTGRHIRITTDAKRPWISSGRTLNRRSSRVEGCHGDRSNTNRETFGNVADGQLTITHYSIIFNYANAGARICFISEAVETQRVLAVGEPMEFPASAFVYTLPSGDGTDAGAKALLDAMIAQHGNPTILLGTAAMGDAGQRTR